MIIDTRKINKINKISYICIYEVQVFWEKICIYITGEIMKHYNKCEMNIKFLSSLNFV